MKNSAAQGEISDEDANKMLDEILEEDKKENEDDDYDDDADKCEFCAAKCAADCAQGDNKFCECVLIAENSSRFSLRVMEAMRWLQNEEEDSSLPTSSVEDIVGYIQANYRDEGDLYAQVRTVLKQVCSQGFVMELLKNEYYLIGPDAISMNQTACSNARKDRSLPSSPRISKRRRKSNYNDCSCETPFEESGRTSRRRKNEYEDDNVAEEAPECSCNVTLTDEDVDDCTCEAEMHRSGRDISSRRNRLQGNGDKELSEESEARMKSQMNNFRRRRSTQGSRRTSEVNDRRTENGELNEEESDNVNDVYQELQDLIPSVSRNHVGEVKEWIKRCQEKCKQRAKRGDMNN
ncbi:PREDICTED: uncharacterized protein LOC108577254 [Habropoda laboriosa]|uniref:uncharacterized protein LOC108577254 n=1 Tax=Habropoda laboriosa TaxID=597456 RepID=UPI00083CB6EB|nr:PREDICTED: uncharacterized protein LOC108577254 [Habropoda laboriosa]